MAPLLNGVDVDLTVHGHPESLVNMLPRDVGVQLEQCRFDIADNCSVNRLLVTLKRVPLAGCPSRRLNLTI
jgi:hypothetical protein